VEDSINSPQEDIRESSSSTEPDVPAKVDNKRSGGRTIMISVCLSVTLMVATLAAYDQFYAQKVVALDVKGYVAEQRDLFLAGKINEDELKRNFDKLEQVKEKVPKNKIIILGDVLVRKNVEEIKP